MTQRVRTGAVILMGGALLTGCAGGGSLFDGPLFGGDYETTHLERVGYDRSTDDRAPPGIGGAPGAHRGPGPGAGAGGPAGGVGPGGGGGVGAGAGPGAR